MSAVLPIDQIMQKLDSLTMAVMTMAKTSGDRLTRTDVCNRLGIHRNSVNNYIENKDFPKPTLDGKWLLCEVMQWEARH